MKKLVFVTALMKYEDLKKIGKLWYPGNRYLLRFLIDPAEMGISLN
jgi:hypothetical protein